MECPKCTTNGVPTRMHHEVTSLGANSLERHTESQMVSGYKCHQCGKWIDDEPVISMPEIPPVEQQLARPSGKRPRLNPKPTARHRVETGKRFRAEVRKRLEEISGLRLQGLAWYDIAAQLGKEGFKISYTCLRLHYQAIVKEEQKQAA